MDLTIRRDIEVIRILQGDTVLYTVCEPSGPGLGHMGVFEGTGLDENDEELPPVRLIVCSPVRDAENEAVKVAVGLAMSKVDF